MAFQFGGSNSGQQRPTNGPPGGPQVPPGGAPTRGGGFQGAPTPRKHEAPPTAPVVPNPAPEYTRGQNWNTPRPNRTYAPRANISIPWRIIIPALLIIAAIVLCVIYRDSITQFLAQILAWLIVIVIIVLIIRGLIFGRRRRW